jgi:hypothetical protein
MAKNWEMSTLCGRTNGRLTEEMDLTQRQRCRQPDIILKPFNYRPQIDTKQDDGHYHTLIVGEAAAVYNPFTINSHPGRETPFGWGDWGSVIDHSSVRERRQLPSDVCESRREFPADWVFWRKTTSD